MVRALGEGRKEAGLKIRITANPKRVGSLLLSSPPLCTHLRQREVEFRTGDENDYCLHHHHHLLPIWPRLTSPAFMPAFHFLSLSLEPRFVLRATQFRKCTINIWTATSATLLYNHPCQFLPPSSGNGSLSALIVEQWTVSSHFSAAFQECRLVADRTRGITG